MVNPSDMSLNTEAFNIIPSASSGAVTAVSAYFPGISTLNALLGAHNVNFDKFTPIQQMVYCYELAAALYGAAGIKQWDTVIRSVGADGTGIDYQYANGSTDYDGIIYMPDPLGTIADTMKQIDPDGVHTVSMVALDPRDSTLGAISYLPALPTSSFIDTVRGIAESLGMPIVDLVTHFVLYRRYIEMPSQGITNFSIDGTVPTNTTDSVAVTWYDTVGHLSSGAPYTAYAADNVISIESGETQEFVVQMDATPFQIDETVEAVAAIPFAGGKFDPSGGKSVACITGSDGYIVSPARWADNGGSITVRRGSGPYDLIVSITAAVDPGIAPFTITEGADRPALYVVGQGGVTWTRRTATVSMNKRHGTPWGDDTSNARVVKAPNALDMPYVDTLDRAYGAAVRYAGTYTAPQLTCQGEIDLTMTPGVPDDGTGHEAPPQELANGISVPLLPVHKFYRDHNMWVITNVTWTKGSGVAQFQGRAFTTAADFDKYYGHTVFDSTTGEYKYDPAATTTIADFNQMISAAGVSTVSEFSSVPLIAQPAGI